MSKPPILILTGSHRPHHVLLLAYSLVVGLVFMLGAPRPESVTSQLSSPFVDLWFAGLVASGLIGLVGCFWRGGMRRGLMLERSAMLIGAGSVFGYAWSVAQLGTQAIFTAGSCAAWGIANLVRVYQIGRDLRALGEGEREANA